MTEADLGVLEEAILDHLLMQPKPWFFGVVKFLSDLDQELVKFFKVFWS